MARSNTKAEAITPSWAECSSCATEIAIWMRMSRLTSPSNAQLKYALCFAAKF
jgi:hypothetical protein